MRVKMNDATATPAMEGFSAALNGMQLAMRKRMTYDQGAGNGAAHRHDSEDGCGDLLLRPTQPLAARQQRKHQRPHPPTPAQEADLPDTVRRN